MKRNYINLALVFLFMSFNLLWGATADTLETADGPVKIRPIKHASLMLEFRGKVIHIDPWSQADYTGLPKADMIIITDVRQDHMDPVKINDLKKPGTVIVAPSRCGQDSE
jgi:L-ascorbate metabolism protein UlaG (beta-lactamase superfamily)